MRSILGRFWAKRAMKVRIEGPLDVTLERKVIRQLQEAGKKVDGILVVINSYGGSLPVANNIASSLVSLRARKIPVYCFAEEYCLNSANLILTAGTRCFANKLSVLGDIGFAYQKYAVEGKLEVQRISNDAIGLELLLGDNFQFKKQQNIDSFMQQQLRTLQEGIFSQRQQQLSSASKNKNQLSETQLSGSISPQDAQQAGLIDAISSCNGFVRKELVGWKLIEGSEKHQYKVINFIRSALEVFKQE